MIIKEKGVKPIRDVCGELREIYSSQNISISTIIFLPGSSAKPHLHRKMEEIYYVISGKGRIKIGKKLLEIWESDVIPIPKNVFHAASNPYNAPMKLLVVTYPRFSQEDVLTD